MDKNKTERDALSELYDSLIKELEDGIQSATESDDLLTLLDEFKAHKLEVLGETKSDYA